MNSAIQDEALDEFAAGSRIPVLVSIEPGFLRDSLITILRSFHFVMVVGEMPGEQRCLSKVCQLQPHIVLIDCSPNIAGWPAFLRELRERNPKIKCLAIADTFHTGKLALKYGADEVLTSGFTGQELELVLKRMARLPRNNPPQAVAGKEA